MSFDREKVQQILEFWKAVDEGNIPQVKSSTGWIDITSGPNLRSVMNNYRIKPALISVVFDKLMKSEIDCQFCDTHEDGSNKLAIGPLLSVDYKTSKYKYISNRNAWKYCKPRENHWHFWIPKAQSESPLPKGIKVTIMTREGDKSSGEASGFSWNKLSHMIDSEIIAFQVLGLADGYCWPWETNENNS